MCELGGSRRNGTAYELLRTSVKKKKEMRMRCLLALTGAPPPFLSMSSQPPRGCQEAQLALTLSVVLVDSPTILVIVICSVRTGSLPVFYATKFILKRGDVRVLQGAHSAARQTKSGIVCPMSWTRAYPRLSALLRQVSLSLQVVVQLALPPPPPPQRTPQIQLLPCFHRLCGKKTVKKG